MKNLTIILLAFMLMLGATNSFAGTVTLNVTDSYDNNLAGVKVYYNNYGNNYVLLGTTNGAGVNATVPDGLTKFKAILNSTEQIISGSVGTSALIINFQTSEFVVHVKKSDGSPFSGIAASFNDYGNNYLSMGNTDAFGNASIQLFPGTRKFKATKNQTFHTADLTISDTGQSDAVSFQTSEFIVNVKKSDGSPFSGIAASFNDYGNNYLSMGNTDGDGNAKIQLFPGTRKFKATKNQTFHTADLTISDTGQSDAVNFQTSLGIGLVRDCSGGTPVPLQGIQVSFNDYGNNWLNFGPTDIDGKAYIELFSGNYNFRATTNSTSQAKPISLSGTSTLVEFNPTKLCFSYSGTVKYNDYGANWMTITCGKYLFPGTYKFSFNGLVKDVAVSGCVMNNSVITTTLKNSSGTPVPGGKAYLGVGGWPLMGETDANGNLAYIHSSTLVSMSVRMTAPNYGGTQTSPSQNIPTNSHFNFKTDRIVLQLKHSDGSLQDDGEILAGFSGWPKIGETGNNGQGAFHHEMFLPATYKFRMSYNKGTEEKSKDFSVGANTLIWQTGLVKFHFSGTITHKVGGWPAFSNPYEMLPVQHGFGFSGSGYPPC